MNWWVGGWVLHATGGCTVGECCMHLVGGWVLHTPCGRVYWVGKCCMHLVGGCTGWVSVACTLWEGVLGG